MQKRGRAEPAHWALRALSGIIASGVLAILAVLVISRRTETKAEDCLKQVLQLPLGQATFEDIQRLKAEFHALDITSEGGQPKSCNPGSCHLLFTFNNAWLHRLRLAPLFEFGVGVELENGRVEGRGAGLVSYAPKAGGQFAVDETLPVTGRKDVEISRLDDASGVPARVMVSLTTAAPPAFRLRAYSFDLSCLSKLGGCKDRHKIIPVSGADTSLVVPPTQSR